MAPLLPLAVSPFCTTHGGDIDLFGFEDAPTLKDHQQRIQSETDVIRELHNLLEANKFWGPTLIDTSTGVKEEVNRLLKEINIILSIRIKELRESKVSREMALVKFKKLCGADWRNSKYVYVISSLETSLFDTNIILRDLLDAADMVHKCICVIHGNQADFCPGDTVLLDNQRNYNCLPEAGHG